MKKLLLLLLSPLFLIVISGCSDAEYIYYEIDDLVYVENTYEEGVFTTKEKQENYVHAFYTVDGEQMVYKRDIEWVDIGSETILRDPLDWKGSMRLTLSKEDYKEMIKGE